MSIAIAFLLGLGAGGSIASCLVLLYMPRDEAWYDRENKKFQASLDAKLEKFKADVNATVAQRGTYTKDC